MHRFRCISCIRGVLNGLRDGDAIFSMFHQKIFVAFLWTECGTKSGKTGQRVIEGRWYVSASINALAELRTDNSKDEMRGSLPLRCAPVERTRVIGGL